MARENKTEKTLRAAGFKIGRKIGGGWYEVTTPDGDLGVVLKQSEAAWHFFFEAFTGTASGSSAATCHKGGLGDALSTDSQVKTYKRLILAAPRTVQTNPSVCAAMSQAGQD